MLALAASGDANAFGVIYQHYQHIVYRFALAMAGSRDAAEDVAQEVFVTLFRDLGRYDPSRASFTTYLYGIVRNLSRERLRRDRRLLSLAAITLGARESIEADPFDAIDGAQTAAGNARGAATAAAEISRADCDVRPARTELRGRSKGREELDTRRSIAPASRTPPAP